MCTYIQTTASVHMCPGLSQSANVFKAQFSVHMCTDPGKCAHVFLPRPVCTCVHTQSSVHLWPRPVCTCAQTQASVHMCFYQGQCAHVSNQGQYALVARPWLVWTCVQTQASVHMYKDPGQHVHVARPMCLWPDPGQCAQSYSLKTDNRLNGWRKKVSFV